MKFLLTSDSYWYNGKEVNITNKVSDIVKSLPSLQKVVVAPLLGIETDYYDDKFINYSGVQEKYFTQTISFEPLNLDDPLGQFLKA